ncbi:MAG: pilus assembly PilX N-terminal domain-containing protein [Candidatus Eisenbacteria bacterium]
MFAIIDGGPPAIGWLAGGAAVSRGSTVILAVMMLLVLSMLGMVLVSMVGIDLDIAAAHLSSVQALFVAEAGRQFAAKMLTGSPGWTGLSAPGKAVGLGSFVVEVRDSLEDGTPLSPGQKFVGVTGTVNGAERKLRVVVSPSGSSGFTTWATAQGNAVSVQSGKKYTSIANIYDSSSGPNGTYGSGQWSPSGPYAGVFTGFTNSGYTGTVTKVEAAISFYITNALSNDDVQLSVYLDNSRQGSTYTIATATLNQHVGVANKGVEYIEVTGSRTWSMSDLEDDLELYVEDSKQGSADASTIYIDAVGYRVTYSTAAEEVARTWKELVD